MQLIQHCELSVLFPESKLNLCNYENRGEKPSITQTPCWLSREIEAARGNCRVEFRAESLKGEYGFCREGLIIICIHQ